MACAAREAVRFGRLSEIDPSAGIPPRAKARGSRIWIPPRSRHLARKSVCMRLRYSGVYVYPDFLCVSRGEHVEKGDPIGGKVGTSGNATGPHLRFARRRDREPDDLLSNLP